MAVETERRRSQRRPRTRMAGEGVVISFTGSGKPDVTASLVDISEWGVGVETSTPLEVGLQAVVSGQFFSARSDLGSRRSVRIVHCRSHDSRYRCGLAFEEQASNGNHRRQATQPEAESSVVDHYEALQISPNADIETVQRVYRMLAQRFHPDNSETGDEAAFRSVLQAFHVLSDPEKRASYDAQYRVSRTLRWKIFDQPTAAQGIEGERRTRSGILSILYTKRLEEPEKPGLSVKDLEGLLGCPREHLEFSLWYLRAKSLITAGDNSRYQITAEGVDAFQDAELRQTGSSSPLMLEAAQPAVAAVKPTNGKN